VTIAGPDGIDVLLDPADLRSGLLADARAGLTAEQKWLPPKYFYDARGSELFEQITALEEYYPTRTEYALLERYGGEIARAAGADTLLELGAGSARKTRLLLDGMARAGHLSGYVPVDVSSEALAEAVEGIRREYSGLYVRGVVADIEHQLAQLPTHDTRMIALLGSTLGNFCGEDRTRLLAGLADVVQPGESLLLGVDLVKDPTRLVAAYDDPAGVTAEFNRNVLYVLNRELGADFDPAAFEHVAHWDADHDWIEMRLRATAEMRVRLPALDLEIGFDRGEHLRTEISAKFRRPPLEAELVRAGLEPLQWWSDEHYDYGLVLAGRP